VAPAVRPIRRRLRTRGGFPRQPSGWVIAAPDFVGVGAQRAGTTWWYRVVCDHPMIQRVAVKELHFFDPYRTRPFSSADVWSYHRHFPRPAGSLTGEWSPRYMYDFWTPALLRAAAPDAKLLVLLRDPLERYLSGRSHEAAALRWAVLRHRPYIDAMTANDALGRSLYARQLARLFEHFDRRQVLVLQYERCVRAPAAELRRTYEFLGVDAPDHVPEFIGEHAGRFRPRIEITKPELEAARRAIVDDVANLRALVPEVEVDLWPSCRPDGAPPISA
jgi:Sulfotransferase domain